MTNEVSFLGFELSSLAIVNKIFWIYDYFFMKWALDEFTRLILKENS